MYCILNLQLVLDSVLEAHGLITNIQTWVNLKTSSPLYNTSLIKNSQTWLLTSFSSQEKVTVESMSHIFHGKFMNIINLLTIKFSLEPDIILKDLWLEMELPTGTMMFHQVSHLLPITSILSQRKHMIPTLRWDAKFSSMISSQDSQVMKTKQLAITFGTMMSKEACAT